MLLQAIPENNTFFYYKLGNVHSALSENLTFAGRCAFEKHLASSTYQSSKDISGGPQRAEVNPLGLPHFLLRSYQ